MRRSACCQHGQIVCLQSLDDSVGVRLDSPAPRACVELHDPTLNAVELGRPQQRVQLDPGAHKELYTLGRFFFRRREQHCARW